MLAKAPGEDAGAGTRRADDENRTPGRRFNRSGEVGRVVRKDCAHGSATSFRKIRSIAQSTKMQLTLGSVSNRRDRVCWRWSAAVPFSVRSCFTVICRSLRSMARSNGSGSQLNPWTSSQSNESPSSLDAPFLTSGCAHASRVSLCSSPVRYHRASLPQCR